MQTDDTAALARDIIIDRVKQLLDVRPNK